MKKVILLTAMLLTASHVSGQPGRLNDSFGIIALGDMPYFIPEDYSRFENVITAINKAKPDFSVHVGDIKSGSTLCTNEAFKKIADYFGQFENPLVYTPGDNEWTDCNRPKAGSYDPEERLSVIRKIFFSTGDSFGKAKIVLSSEASNPAFSKYVENKKWDYKGICFATVHLVGTNNNFVPADKNHCQEFFGRDEANLNWLREIFSSAKKTKAAGIVIFTQADMFAPGKELSGFTNILEELTRLTLDYDKQVLLVNGDSHKFIVDKPLLRDEKTKKVIENFTRVQVFGEQDIHAVKIIFNTADESLFVIQPFIVKGN